MRPARPSTSVPSVARGYGRLVAINVAVLAVILALVEGTSSCVLLTRSIATTPSLAERKHTVYDPVLGWVNERNRFVPDMYGAGAYLQTNSRGFRNRREFAAAVPAGMARVVCSGDSFTLGYGVSNDETWCRGLADLDPRLEAVNMGQGGYSVSQAYLWYRRDGDDLEHQVYLLAYIPDDFRRMRFDTFQGYGKPWLDVERGALVVRNLPVPRAAYDYPWLVPLADGVRRLSTVQLLAHVSRRLGLSPDGPEPVRGDDAVRKVVRLLFEDLQRRSQRQSRGFALVSLPTLGGLSGEGDDWHHFVASEARRLGIPLIDVLAEFRSLPYLDVSSAFIPEGQVAYTGAAGHLNARGNALVAKAVYQALMNEPRLFRPLAFDSPSRDGRRER